jgi:phage terminase small subunit
MEPRKLPLMTPFELAFVRVMIETPCAPIEAARLAGYAPATTTFIGPALMKRYDIVEAIQAGRDASHKAIGERTGIQLADLVRILAQMATFDIAELYDTDGNLKPLDEIPAHARIAIESIDSEEVYEGRGRDRQQVATVKKVRMAKRNEAIDKLMRHLGGYELDNKQHLEPLTQLLGELAKRGRNTLAISNDG